MIIKFGGIELDNIQVRVLALKPTSIWGTDDMALAQDVAKYLVKLWDNRSFKLQARRTKKRRAKMEKGV